MIEAIDLIGVPLDLGVRELGLKLGPDAMREAGLSAVALRMGLDVRDLGNLSQPNIAATADDDHTHAPLIAAYCKAVAETVSKSIEDGRVPICLGGDHSLTIGSMAGVAGKLGRVGCLWLDSHPDANTPETSPSGNIHGMPLAILLGHGPKSLVALGPPGGTLAYRDASVIGAVDIDAGEAEFLRRSNVQMFTIFDVLEQGLPAVLDCAIERVTAETRGVHVSLDMDVLHHDAAPGVGMPSQCGFSVREARYVCRKIADRCPIVSIDVVGLNPVHDRDRKTARLAIELLMALLGHEFSFNYNGYLREQERLTP